MAEKKSPHDKSPADVLSDLMNVPFPNTAYVESMKRVFTMQKHMLDNFQANLDRWFERRREGTDATIEMLQAMKGERDKEKRAEAWQRWVSGTMARIMDDVQTQFDMMAKITGQLAENGEVVLPPELKAVKTRPLNGKSAHHPAPKKPASAKARLAGPGPRTSH